MSGAISYSTPQNRKSKRTIERTVKKADKAGISKTGNTGGVKSLFFTVH